MNDETQAKLEKQVADLTAEVASLKRYITNGFIVLGILLAVGLGFPGLIFYVVAFGLPLWAVAYIGMTLGSALSRRAQRKRRLSAYLTPR